MFGRQNTRREIEIAGLLQNIAANFWTRRTRPAHFVDRPTTFSFYRVFFSRL